MSFISDIGPVYWALGAVALVTGALLHGLCSRIRRRHPDVWEALGRPSVLRTSEYDFRTVRRFVSQRQFLALQDPVLNRWGWTVLVYKRVLEAALIGIALWLLWLAVR